MISQKATFYPNHLIKSFIEYSDDVLLYKEEYDLFGNMTYFENSAGWVRITFNEIGKLIKEENSVSDTTLIIDYYRNGYGNKKQAKTICSNGDWFIIEYEMNGNIKASYDSLGNKRNF
jgi:hypothetical protein